MAQQFNTRNEALEFARRTRLNLEFIEHAAAGDPTKVHVVTQLTLSLLGLVVFPKEKLLLDHTTTKTLASLTNEGCCLDDYEGRWKRADRYTCRYSQARQERGVTRPTNLHLG